MPAPAARSSRSATKTETRAGGAQTGGTRCRRRRRPRPRHGCATPPYHPSSRHCAPFAASVAAIARPPAARPDLAAAKTLSTGSDCRWPTRTPPRRIRPPSTPATRTTSPARTTPAIASSGAASPGPAAPAAAVASRENDDSAPDRLPRQGDRLGGERVCGPPAHPFAWRRRSGTRLIEVSAVGEREHGMPPKNNSKKYRAKMNPSANHNLVNGHATDRSLAPATAASSSSAGAEAALAECESALRRCSLLPPPALPSSGASTSGPVCLVERTGPDAAERRSRCMDVAVEQINLMVGRRELLSSATLKLTYGRKYGLVGRNGEGKTQLLCAIARRELPVPEHIRIVHVEQEIEGDDTSVLEAVLRSDWEREYLLEQERRLEQDESDAAGEALLEVYGRLEELGADAAETRASSVLAGLESMSDGVGDRKAPGGGGCAWYGRNVPEAATPVGTLAGSAVVGRGQQPPGLGVVAVAGAVSAGVATHGADGVARSLATECGGAGYDPAAPQAPHVLRRQLRYLHQDARRAAATRAGGGWLSETPRRRAQVVYRPVRPRPQEDGAASASAHEDVGAASGRDDRCRLRRPVVADRVSRSR
eukprot:ctg_347.g175